jgi:hypothetical protein
MLILNLDIKDFLDIGEDIRPKVAAAMNEAAKKLALQTDAHIKELVQAKLKSTRQKYLAAMDIKPIGESTWLITLDASAMWIEEGMDEHEMIDDLLKSKKAKTSADGSRYLNVPFQHNKGPTSQTQAQIDLTSTIRKELKKRDIPYGNLEHGPDGQPKQGLLHSFDIMKSPIKTFNGPGQGKGQIGQVRQGPTGIPFLQGIRVYQKQIKDQSTGKIRTVKSIMTFRTVSSKMKGSGRWVHPGLDEQQFFDKAAEWALRAWENEIRPKVLADLAKTI